eukprot:CAMPEP_0206139262 /NCGR_PEP_ID=MMETSP1473-20131121/5285_1 /ASSEMBLY_ACC=CAM_ASM_001109 /TAXON_ID=1461547 /ORGANISM="Stichococcus sp, Strain RCC1054" /LENGTH=35 /DNA_ID= /DNA_START= /DNA_END= /DNA_ORIENTATION=
MYSDLEDSTESDRETRFEHKARLRRMVQDLDSDSD